MISEFLLFHELSDWVSPSAVLLMKEVGRNVYWLQQYLNSWIFDNTSCVKSISKFCLYLQNRDRVWNFSSPYQDHCCGAGSLVLPVFSALSLNTYLLSKIWCILLFYELCHIHCLSFRLVCRRFLFLVCCCLPSALSSTWHIVCTHIPYFVYKWICFIFFLKVFLKSILVRTYSWCFFQLRCPNKYNLLIIHIHSVQPIPICHSR